MVRAILAGTKTQTRRVCRKVGERGADGYGDVGDRLWVRESFAPLYFDDGRPAYMADYDGDVVPRPRFKPSIHMPRAVSRIDLEIDAVRIERLQDITEADAKAEGVTDDGGPEVGLDASPRAAFRVLWDVISGKRAPWASNPWVWVVGFRRVPS